MTHLTHFLRFGLLLGLGWAGTALASPAASPAEPLPLTLSASDTAGPAAPQLDADGVIMALPPHPEGSSWSLGTQDPNRVDPEFFDMEGDPATRHTEGGLTYWSTPGHVVTYRSGMPDGRTVRLHMRPGGGTQTYTWLNGAREHGYIGTPRDLKNFEATAYVRVRDFNGTHTSMSWKMRGGLHLKADETLGSCVGMGVPHGDKPAPAFRELNHPFYDYVNLTPHFPYSLQEGEWLAVKIVSYGVEGGTRNLLSLDTEPFDAQGRPRNEFRLYTEWMDRDGEDTGLYSQAATWASWVTSFRVDGWRAVDFAILSAREVIPPAS